jgi:hypothetical protein
VRSSGPPIQSSDSVALAGVAGQAGCVTLAVVVLALVVGQWLDNQLGTRYIITLGLILASVPLSIVLMLRTVLRGMERFHAARGHRQVASGPGGPVGGLWRKPGERLPSGAGEAGEAGDEDDNGGGGP